MMVEHCGTGLWSKHPTVQIEAERQAVRLRAYASMCTVNITEAIFVASLVCGDR